MAFAICFLGGYFGYKISKDIMVGNVAESQEIEWLNDSFDTGINLENIIQNNLNNEIKEIIETKVVELEYETQYQNNPSLPKGKVQVLQQGQDGKQELF